MLQKMIIWETSDISDYNVLKRSLLQYSLGRCGKLRANWQHVWFIFQESLELCQLITIKSKCKKSLILCVWGKNWMLSQTAFWQEGEGEGERLLHTAVWGISVLFLCCDSVAQKKHPGVVGWLVLYHQQSEKEITNIFAFLSSTVTA